MFVVLSGQQWCVTMAESTSAEAGKGEHNVEIASHYPCNEMITAGEILFHCDHVNKEKLQLYANATTFRAHG